MVGKGGIACSHFHEANSHDNNLNTSCISCCITSMLDNVGIQKEYCK